MSRLRRVELFGKPYVWFLYEGVWQLLRVDVAMSALTYAVNNTGQDERVLSP
jgi:hypothetical protein